MQTYNLFKDITGFETYAEYEFDLFTSDSWLSYEERRDRTSTFVSKHLTPCKRIYHLDQRKTQRLTRLEKFASFVTSILFISLYYISSLSRKFERMAFQGSSRSTGLGTSEALQVPLGTANTIPADVLADRSRAYRETVPSRVSVLPRSRDVYSDRVTRFMRLGWQGLVGNTATTMRIENAELTTLGGNHVVDVPIPFLGAEATSVNPVVMAMDERLTPTVRSSSGPNLAHVGVVEILVDGLVAQNARTVAGALLYDARHQDREQAFLGAFASTIASEPSRVLFYPDHTVSLLQADAARTLHLAIVLPNNDMREHDIAAHIRVGSIAQFTRGSFESTHTARLINHTRTDRAEAVRYLGQNMHVIHAASRPQVEMPNISIPFGRSISMRQTAALQWEAIERPRQSVVLQFDNPNNRSTFSFDANSAETPPTNPDPMLNESQGQAVSSLEVEMKVPIVQAGEMTQRVLYSGTASIATNAAEGTILASFSMAEVMSAQTTHAPMLQTYGRVPGKVLLRSKCQIPAACGISLFWIYKERGAPYVSPLAVKQAASDPHIFWNPACQSSIDFWVAPFSCSSYWIPSYFSSMESHFVLACSTPWQQAPKTAAAVQFALYMEPSVEAIPRITNVLSPENIDYFRFLGTIAFKQQAYASAQVLDLSLGLPCIYSSGLGHNSCSAIMSQFQYWKGDVFVEIVKASSPFVTATISVALLPGGKAWATDQCSLSLVPHVTVAIDPQASRYVCKIPKEVTGAHLLANNEVASLSRGKKLSAVLAIWIRDSVTSSVDGDLTLNVSVSRVENLECLGFSSGYPFSASRAQLSVGEAKYQDVFKVIMPDTQKGVVTYEISLHRPLAVTVNDKVNVGMERFYCPLVNILQTSAWARGTIYWKLIWYSKPMQMALRTNCVDIEVHETSIAGSYAYVRDSSYLPSGKFEWETYFAGPIDGFMFLDNKFGGQQAFTTLRVQLSEASECSGIILMAKFGSDFAVSGSAGGLYRSVPKTNMSSIVSMFP
uniref:RNA2 polyprotein n=1 Tax=Prunus virus F TaxID=1855510 RepID=A0A2R2Z1R9_9SECO|nr:polyprotein 2 [Prunus virus F]